MTAPEFSDLAGTLRDTINRPNPGTCIWITSEQRMCGEPADPQRLGLCAEHWREVVAAEKRGTP